MPTIGNGGDYSSVTTTEMFKPCETKKCITILIIDDLTVEEAEESFNVTLALEGDFLDTAITFEPASAVVTIIDNDGMCSLFRVFCYYYTLLK